MTELVAALLMVHGSLSGGSRNVKVYNFFVCISTFDQMNLFVVINIHIV